MTGAARRASRAGRAAVPGQVLSRFPLEVIPNE